MNSAKTRKPAVFTTPHDSVRCTSTDHRTQDEPAWFARPRGPAKGRSERRCGVRPRGCPRTRAAVRCAHVSAPAGMPEGLVEVDAGEAAVSMELDATLYPLDALYGAAYTFIDRAYVLL